MVKHFKDMTGCVVVGDLPTWYASEHIPCEDIPKRREQSVYEKIKKVEGIILYSNDDYFAFKDFDSSLPNYYHGICRDKARRMIDKTYKELFRKCNPEWLSFEIHCPMVIDTRLLDFEDCLLKTTYANLLKLPGTISEDVKLRHNPSYGYVKEIIKGQSFFSTHDNGSHPGILKILKELYPEKSKFEV